MHFLSLTFSISCGSANKAPLSVYRPHGGLTAIQVHHPQLSDCATMKLLWCLVVIASLFEEFAEGENVVMNFKDHMSSLNLSKMGPSQPRITK